MKISILQSILAIKDGSQATVLSDDVNTIIWHDNNPANITNEQIVAKQTELQNAEDNRIVQEIANKQSALNKLKALGLNDAEINSILGK
jgi:hypothetical protein